MLGFDDWRFSGYAAFFVKIFIIGAFYFNEVPTLRNATRITRSNFDLRHESNFDLRHDRLLAALCQKDYFQTTVLAA
jgi:hypothetical protein